MTNSFISKFSLAQFLVVSYWHFLKQNVTSRSQTSRRIWNVEVKRFEASWSKWITSKIDICSTFSDFGDQFGIWLLSVPWDDLSGTGKPLARAIGFYWAINTPKKCYQWFSLSEIRYANWHLKFCANYFYQWFDVRYAIPHDK